MCKEAWVSRKEAKRTRGSFLNMLKKPIYHSGRVGWGGVRKMQFVPHQGQGRGLSKYCDIYMSDTFKV
jgi:hypothetical protein